MASGLPKFGVGMNYSKMNKKYKYFDKSISYVTNYVISKYSASLESSLDQITCQPVNQAICIFITVPIVFCNLVSIKCIMYLLLVSNIFLTKLSMVCAARIQTQIRNSFKCLGH